MTTKERLEQLERMLKEKEEIKRQREKSIEDIEVEIMLLKREILEVENNLQGVCMEQLKLGIK